MRWIGLAALVISACGPSTSDDGTCTSGTPCNGSCVDLSTDRNNCGTCGHACNANQTCSGGECHDPQPTCTPDTTEACYDGPAGTENVGPCHGGTRTCSAGGTWGPCAGEVLPQPEVCGNGLDEDCSGVADDVRDADGDGFTNCDGDCCDSSADGCSDPGKVNPGAIDAPGNGLDDDCDGTIDNGTTETCDSSLASNSADPMDYARAIDLCKTAVENPTTPAERGWGVISAQLLLPSGSGAPAADSRAIRTEFGGTTVQGGQSFAVLSTSHAADQDDTNPAFATFESTDMGKASTVPMDWLTAAGGKLPNAPGCPEPVAGQVFDGVMLQLRIRTPTNASSFTVSTNFFSAEYPEWVCSPFNDFFVVVLGSTWAGTPANPPDGNLAMYTAPGGQKYPVGVNLAFGNTGLFRECLNGNTGCAEPIIIPGMPGTVPGTTSACTGTAGLAGTGFDLISESGCGSSNLVGGGTGWLATSGNVVGGEIITVRIAIWDTSDALFDSVAIIDNWQWSLAPAEPGTVVD